MGRWSVVLIKPFSFISINQGSDVSNFIGSDQKVAPYQLVVF